MKPAPPVTIAVGKVPSNLHCRGAALLYAAPVAFPSQAMILAAGRGTRLGALGEQRAKALVEIDGRPLLARQLEFLAEQGVERAVVNASHLAEQLEEFVERHHAPPAVEVVVEPEALGTAGGVLNALPRFLEGSLAILYGDAIVREPLAEMATLHHRTHPVATLAVYRSDHAEAKGIVELDGTLVTGFVEKDPARTAGWVNAGLYIAETSWLAAAPTERPLDFGHDLFPDALRRGMEIRAHGLAEVVLDIGTPADLARARERGLS
jgi:NDP-sugar pyrophosphorylase family protein